MVIQSNSLQLNFFDRGNSVRALFLLRFLAGLRLKVNISVVYLQSTR